MDFSEDVGCSTALFVGLLLFLLSFFMKIPDSVYIFSFVFVLVMFALSYVFEFIKKLRGKELLNKNE